MCHLVRIASVCCAAALLSLPFSAGRGLATEFYYFNPDSPQSNLTLLKREMDRFLSDSPVSISFQPFARLRDFDRKVKEGKAAFLFLPGWYLHTNDQGKKIEPLLRPVRQGMATYTKVLLVGKKATVSLRTLQQQTIAMTPMGPNGPGLLNAVLFSRYGLDAGKLNLVTISKDADALFALVLGQVGAALVSRDNFEYISAINPRVKKMVRPLAESDPVPLPLLCYTRGMVTAEEKRTVKRMFLEGQHKKTSANLMGMMQVDAWQDYRP